MSELAALDLDVLFFAGAFALAALLLLGQVYHDVMVRRRAADAPQTEAPIEMPPDSPSEPQSAGPLQAAISDLRDLHAQVQADAQNLRDLLDEVDDKVAHLMALADRLPAPSKTQVTESPTADSGSAVPQNAPPMESDPAPGHRFHHSGGLSIQPPAWPPVSVPPVQQTVRCPPEVPPVAAPPPVVEPPRVVEAPASRPPVTYSFAERRTLYEEAQQPPEPATLPHPHVRYQRIYELAELGYPSEQIAARMGTSVGEVELILALRPVHERRRAE